MAIQVKILSTSLNDASGITEELQEFLTENSLSLSAVRIQGYGDKNEKGLVVVYDDTGASVATGDSVPASYSAVMQQPTGFDSNLVNSTTEFVVDNGTRTIGIQPRSPATSFDFYIQGVKFTKNTAQTLQINDIEGLHYIYFDNTGELTHSLTPWDYTVTAPVTLAYWDVTNQGFLIVSDERHTAALSPTNHLILHRTIGTRWIYGFGISGYTLGSDVDDDLKFALTGGAISDEDITVNIVDDATPDSYFEQVLTPNAECSIAAKIGSAGEIRVLTPSPTDFPALTFDGNTTFTSRLAWNEFVGGAWQLTEATDNYHVAVWVVASTDITSPISLVVGEREDLLLIDAKINNLAASFTLGLGAGLEFKVLYRLIFQTDSTFGGSLKAKLVDVTDFRSATEFAGSSASTVAHSSLPDLSTSGHPAAVSFIADAGGYFPGVTEVETVLQQLGADIYDQIGEFGEYVTVGAAGVFTVFKDAVDYLNSIDGGTIGLIDASIAFGAVDLDLSKILVKSAYVPVLPYSAKVIFDGTGHVTGLYTRLEGVQFELNDVAIAGSYIFDDAGLAVIIELSGQAALVINKDNPNANQKIINNAGAPALVNIFVYDKSTVQANPGDDATWYVRDSTPSVNVYAMDQSEVYVNLDGVTTFEIDDSVRLSAILPTRSTTGTPTTYTRRSLDTQVAHTALVGALLGDPDTVGGSLAQLEQKGFDVKVPSSEATDLFEAIQRSNGKGTIIISDTFTQTTELGSNYVRLVGATSDGSMPTIYFNTRFGVSTLILESLHIVVNDAALTLDALFSGTGPTTVLMNNSILELRGDAGDLTAGSLFITPPGGNYGALVSGTLNLATPEEALLTLTTADGILNYSNMGWQVGDVVTIGGANQDFVVTITEFANTTTIKFDNTIDAVVKDDIGATAYTVGNQGDFGGDLVDDYQTRDVVVSPLPDSRVTFTTAEGILDLEGRGLGISSTVTISGANQDFVVTATGVSGTILRFDNAVDAVVKDDLGATAYTISNDSDFGDDATDDYKTKTLTFGPLEANLAFFNGAGAYAHKIYMVNGSKLLCNRALDSSRKFINDEGGGTSTLSLYCDQTTQIEGNLSDVTLIRFDQVIDVLTSTGTPASVTGANRLTYDTIFPTVPAPRDGDRHYHTTQKRWYTYDIGRTKWLSDGVQVFQFATASSVTNGATLGVGLSVATSAHYAIAEEMTLVGAEVSQDSAAFTSTPVNSMLVNVCNAGTSVTPTVVTSLSYGTDGNLVSLHSSLNVDIPPTSLTGYGLRCTLTGQNGGANRPSDPVARLYFKYRGV